MIAFKRFQAGIYLPSGAGSDTARVGFMFRDADRNDEQVTLEASWNEDLGYYLFFPPAGGDRDWSTFGANVRRAFAAGSNRQFGWFLTTGEPNKADSFIAVTRSTGPTPQVQDSVVFSLRNVKLQITTNPVAAPTVSLDDDTFSISNPGNRMIALSIAPQGGGSTQQINAGGPATLPMKGAAEGTLVAPIALAPRHFEAAETGCFFFAAPAESGEPLTALRYPVLRPEGEQSGEIRVDILAATDPQRSFFAFAGGSIPSYFVDTLGRALTLSPAPTNGAGGGRLVFAPRPVRQLDDGDFYYLTPAGRYVLEAGAGHPGANESARAQLLCGNTGTEFLDVALSADALDFVPDRAAFRVPPAQRPPALPVGDPTAQYLSRENGQAVTSWVSLQVGDPAVKYVAQPERSPLYDPSRSGAVGPNQVFLLAFREQAAWTPGGGAASPVVPMVPYAGVDGEDPQAFLDMESEVINPARRATFQLAVANSSNGFAGAAADADQAMTPQGLLAGFEDGVWKTAGLATSTAGTLQLTEMGDVIRAAFSQNRIFAVISRSDGQFGFTGTDEQLDIADWLFKLSPDGTPAPDGTPPVLIFKFYEGQSIASLIDDTSLWSSPGVFNADAAKIQSYVQAVIADAKKRSHDEEGNPDTSSIYYPFWQQVSDESFAGLLTLNANIVLGDLPPAIRAVLGGMTREEGGQRVSNVDAFRAHHVGVQINDTDSQSPQLALSKSSLFGLVDYERQASGAEGGGSGGAVDAVYAFEVEFLRALFANSELRDFSARIDLTTNQLFDVGVTLGGGGGGGPKAGAGDADNVITITGSYQAHSGGGDSSSGEGVYAFIAERTFEFTFGENPYLDKLTLTKVQFSASDQRENDGPADAGSKSTVTSRFAMWGDLKFKELEALDLFAFEKLSFADLGIAMSFDIEIPASGPPTTSLPELSFSPGNLRFDLAQSTARKGDTSFLDLLPFRLKSFLFSEKADQPLTDLGFFALDIDIPNFAPKGSDTFRYALIFELDLGTLGALVGSLEAFKFTVLVGWRPPPNDGLLLGIQLPEADGKLEIKIEGVLTISIERFVLKYVDNQNGNPGRFLVVALLNSFIELFGKRLPPGDATMDFALFAPSEGAAKIGWIAAYSNESSGDQTAALPGPAPAGDGEDEGGKVFDLLYLGLGQRVGPDPQKPPTNFKDFLSFMTDDFQEAFKAADYAKVYHPEGQWLALAHFKLLEVVELGFVFYDVTPFYSLTINVKDLFDFEITYTKVSDDIGLFFSDFALPESLRQFNVGAVAVALPKIALSIYTNGDWKLDIGFPRGDDWSRSFQLQAQAGPFPVTGSGGFYVAKLSSATSDIFQGDYGTIVAFGLAARLGLGKSFSYGPLNAGVSVTFFGILEGAAAWNAGGNIFSAPNALSLKGELGIIGELYGSIDFKIITASVNVRLVGAIGVQLLSEITTDIDLYVRASVDVSAEAGINLGLFKISVSFTFSASINLSWTLVDTSRSSSAALLEARPTPPRLAAEFPRCPSLAAKLGLWFLPELTVVFADTSNPGEATFACSLGIEYLVPTSGDPVAPGDFKAFETLTAQLATWALARAFSVSGCEFKVTRAAMEQINTDPEGLVGGLDYPTLIGQLSTAFTFAITGIGQPGAESDDEPERTATMFPMFPFLQLTTQGRLDAAGQPQELEYRFDAHNPVSRDYLDRVLAEYYAQSLVQQDAPGGGLQLSTAKDVPLAQAVFLEYCIGLIRGAVDQLTQLMQNEGLNEEAIDTLISKAVGKGSFMNLAGSMSNVVRSGARLPDDGFRLPLGAPAGETVPFYSALWQQFPVGGLSPITRPAGEPTASYTVTLSNPNTSAGWVDVAADFVLTDVAVDPYRSVTAGQVGLPSTPQPLAFLQQGPRSYAFQNAQVWTAHAADGTQTVRSLRPFSPALLELTAARGALELEVASRRTDGTFLGEGAPLEGSQFGWATAITIGVRQVPANNQGSTAAPHVYAISGASHTDQSALRRLIEALQGGGAPSVADIAVLYQTAAGASGLESVTDPTQVFALRTNTTIDSLPPTATFLFAELAAADPAVPVGADIGQALDFLQILEQAGVTNQSGYDLYYAGDAQIEKGDLPAGLFQGDSAAAITILVRFAAETDNPRTVQPWHNAVVLEQADDSLLYSGTTTDPALDTLDVAVAAGTVGVVLDRDNTGARLTTPTHSALAAAEPRAGLRYEEAEAMLRAAGVPDGHARRRLLAESGGHLAGLDQLYTRIAFQIQASGDAFVQGNLSVPASPQGKADATNHEYRIYPPLYKRAQANVGLPAGAFLDRYASLGADYSIDFWLTDSFGNQVPQALSATGKTAYFDNLLAVSEWLGVQTAYDFRAWAAPQVEGMSCQGAREGAARPQARSLTLYLCPNPNTLGPGPGQDPTQVLGGRVELYETIVDQLNGPGVGFYIETNLDSAHSRIALDDAQSQALRRFAQGILDYLKSLAGNPSAPPQPIGLTVTVPDDAGALPGVFGIHVQIGIERDPSLISDQLKQDGRVIYPRAQDVASSAPPRLDGIAIAEFAAEFVSAFPDLVLSVSLDNRPAATSSTHSSPRQRRLAALREDGVPADGSGSRSDTNALWAVQKALVDISVGGSGTFHYLAPKPLDTRLNSGDVPLPQGKPLDLPARRTFVDVDLDGLARAVFRSIDDLLAPVAATGSYRLSPQAYTQVARGREAIARKYSFNEIDWLFPKQGSPADLEAARDVFEEQMRQALQSAYAIDTLVQTEVTWSRSVPASAAGRISLFGQVQRRPATPGPDASGNPGDSTGLSTVRIPVVAGAGGQGGLFTFTFGSAQVREEAAVELDLEYALTHVEYFLEPEEATPAGQARPSLWLQLIDPYPEDGLPHVGPAGSKTTIPLILREYPTPPTTLSQTAAASSPDGAHGDPLRRAASWDFAYEYQAQLTSHDEVASGVTYNTDLHVSGGGGDLLVADSGLTLFETLTRFTAALLQLQPFLADMSGSEAEDAVATYAQLVSQLADNSTWADVPGAVLAASGPLASVTDHYTITDEAQSGDKRLITLCPGNTSWPGAAVSIQAVVKGSQTAGRNANGCVTDAYAAQLVDDWVTHRVTVKNLDVRVAENGLSAVLVRRNAVQLDGQTPREEFIYSTPLVRFTQPTTPFIDDDRAIDVAKLPSSAGTSLPQRIETLLVQLLEAGESHQALRAHLSRNAPVSGPALAADPALSARRLKIECRFRFSLPAAVGGAQHPNLSATYPLLLARSFDLPVEDQSAAIGQLTTLLAEDIDAWVTSNGLSYGDGAKPPGAQLVFDITLYARLSATDNPVLRLRNLQLELADVSGGAP